MGRCKSGTQCWENVWYSECLYAFDDKNYFSWYDTKREEWRMVKGLQILVRNCCDSVIDIAIYGGKLLVLWEKKKPNKWYEKNIWCSVIALERRFGNEVCGIVEWASIVLTVPRSYVFLHCQVDTIWKMIFVFLFKVTNHHSLVPKSCFALCYQSWISCYFITG